MKFKRYLPAGVKSKQTIIGLLRLFSCYSYSPINVLLTLAHALIPRRGRQCKYHVSICLIFKNEAKYLREWIEYHKLLGVEHFYLYNNFSDDNYKDVLKPYIESNEITLIDWPYQYAQIQAYEDAFNRFKNETQWIGFIDADEFVNLKSVNNIKSFLQRYINYPAVFFNWRMFGTSGMTDGSETDLVTERFTACWDSLTDVGKTFANTDYTLMKISPHYTIMKFLGMPVFPIGLNKIPNVLFKTLSVKNIAKHGYINHYWSKSFAEYFYKDFGKGDVASAQNVDIKKQKGRFEYHELQNREKDFSIQRWLVFLKQRLYTKNS